LSASSTGAALRSYPQWENIAEKVKSFGGSISAYTAAGSFALYLLGYVTLRFQLTALGVVSDLPVLDERYLFAGARFLVYLVTAVPIALLLGAPLLLIYPLLRRRFRAWSEVRSAALAGTIFSLLFIQLVARKCFQFMDAPLLRKDLHGDAWLRAVLLDETGGLESIFFSALLLGIGVSACFLIAARQSRTRRPGTEALLGFLLAVQVLLLPVNYAVVIATGRLARMEISGTSDPAWLVWEGTQTVTYLVHGDHRALITIPRSELKQLSITGYEPIRRRLFLEGSDK
jgi:hypothetical protein